MTKTEQPKKEPLNVKTVQLDQKKSAAFLVPDMQDGQKLAVVDESVLKHLTRLLPTARFTEIRDNFCGRLRNTSDLKEMVQCAKDEVAFHETCNLLSRFFDPKELIAMEKPFNVEKSKPTLDEMVQQWAILEADIQGTLGEQSIEDYYLKLRSKGMNDSNNPYTPKPDDTFGGPRIEPVSC